MKKTLIVSYTPREGSNTKRMVDCFIDHNKSKTEITFLELSNTPPDLLLKENLNLYVNRNFGGVVLTDAEEKVLSKNDKMMQQLLDADFVVLACPMYNFSVPATVKAWLDAVIQAGKTFTYTDTGIKGLCENKKALVLMTSGSDFSKAPYNAMNYATPLLLTSFGFMGIEAEAINAFGQVEYADKAEELFTTAKAEIEQLSNKWY